MHAPDDPDGVSVGLRSVQLHTHLARPHHPCVYYGCQIWDEHPAYPVALLASE